MRRMRRLFGVLFLALFGIYQQVEAKAISSDDVRLWLSPSLTTKQMQLLQEDLVFLSNLDLRDNEDGDMRRLFQVSENQNLNKGVATWLNKRVKYVMAGDFQFNPRTVLQTSAAVSYPKPDLFPSFFKDLARNFVKASSSEAGQLPSFVLMENIGARAYGIGKVLRKKLMMQLDEKVQVPVTSPQVGVVQVGPRFFSTLQSAKGSLEDSLYRIRRLETLVHEARHGDGEGRNVTFPHSLCPSDSDYAGQYACDIAANGGYRTGALFLEAAIASCTSCSEKEIEILKVLLADKLSRVVNLLVELPVGPEVLK